MKPDSRPGRDQTVLQLLRPLDPFLERPEVTEVSINRPGEVWTKSFEGWTNFDLPALTMGYLQSLATAIIVYNGLQPKSIVSVTLPGGQRGQIVMPPACLEDTISFSLRKHSAVVKTLEELEREGAFDAWADVSFHRPSAGECATLLHASDFTRLDPFEAELLTLKREGKVRAFLEACVLHKRNIIVAGKTDSGKTTFARSLIAKVPLSERIVTMEDTHELRLESHPNRVHMLYGEGPGRMSATACLESCMRMSPDRIFLAELKGNETWDYVSALNTGHPGSVTTVHADNAILTFARLAQLIKQGESGRQLDIDFIKLTLYSRVNVVLFFRARKLIEIFYDPIFAKSKLA